MGNLLGSPITTKDTHVGQTHTSKLDYGISSMQGWRIHMEDAHIAQPFLFAEKKIMVDNQNSEINSEIKDTKYIKIPLPNHSLFAVFDGHGGSFAAEYASKNLLRLLSRQKAFIAYAQRWADREAYFASLDGGTIVEEIADKDLDDKERLNRMKERGRQSDEKVKKIKEKVQRHLDGEVASCEEVETAEEATNDVVTPNPEMTKAAYDHELMTLLEHALRDAFCDVDAEILREVQGKGNHDANIVYGEGYCPDGGADVGVGHLPNEEGDFDKDEGATDADDHAPTDKEETKPPPSLDEEDSGTTAIVVLLTPKWIVCANSGDSRAIYSRSNHRAIPLSYDHKPEDEDEERRIREAGGYVSGGRVEGDLAVSRGLGDFRFKDFDVVHGGANGENRDRRNSILDVNDESSGDTIKPLLPDGKPSDQKVSPVPDIIVQNRNDMEDEFIVIACDGIWDVQTNQECVQMVADIFSEGEPDIGLVCEEILDLCLIKGSKDNMTAAVVRFPKQIIGAGGGVKARRERRDANDAENLSSGGGLNRFPAPNVYVPMQHTDEDEGKLL